MTDTYKVLNDQLKQVCKLTGARWGVWLKRADKEWTFLADFGINKIRQLSLMDFLSQPKTATWLAGAFSSGRTRSRNTVDLPDLHCDRIYAFANPQEQTALLIGAGDLSKEAQGFFRILSLNAAVEPVPVMAPPYLQPADLSLKNEPDNNYRPQAILNWVLFNLLHLVPSDAAFLALRHGDRFRVEHAVGFSKAVSGKELVIVPGELLARIVERQQGAVLEASDLLPELLLSEVLGEPPQAALVQPILLGKRVIGLAVLISYRAGRYSTADLQQARRYLEQTAHSVDSAVVFSNITRYLQQFALLTELAAATASGADTDEVSRRVSHRLRRAFRTELVTILLLASDGQTLREFGIQRQTRPVRIPVQTSLAGYVVETELPIRVGDIEEAPRYQKKHAAVNSALIVPLKFRRSVIGVLSVESEERDAFNAQDEQLLVVIASHLAGLLENIRLYGEAVERALNLNLIHKVVQRIVGLTDVDEISQATAEMMAEYFGYEFVLVMLTDEKKETLVLHGLGGTQAHLTQKGSAYAAHLGITGHVFQTGKSYYTNNTSQDPYYFTRLNWLTGSELCVPLQDGDQTIGVLNLEHSIQHAFNEQDLQLVDSLAGILSSVLMNARRYQELRTTVSQLNAVRATALEITADLDSRVLFQQIIHRACELVDARGAGLGLVDQDAQQVRIVVHETPWFPPQLPDEGFKIPFHQGVVGEVAATGKPLRVDDYATWEKHQTRDGKYYFHAAAGVPLIWRGEVIGVLMVMDDKPGRVFQDSDIQILQLLAPQVAASIRNATLYDELMGSLEAQQRVENQLVLSARLAALGEMAAGAAHELNNPLTTIAGFVELAIDELPTHLPQYEELKLVLGEALRARRVVRGLLDFAHQRTNLVQPADLNDLLSEVLTLVQLQAQNSNIQIQLELRDDLPLIHIDANQIKQVVINLIQNAFQSMPNGGSLILTTGHQQHEGQAGVFLAVQDSGEGIAPENLGRIFDPFFTTRPVGQGTGLGLSMSYGLVASHGGFLSVESQEGAGSCFTVWLPHEPEVIHA